MSQNPQNFYHLMLGLPADVSTPDYYALLGLNRFEDDAGRVHSAAIDRNRQLLSWQNSEFHREADRLIDEIVAAREALSDPRRKDAYDRRLGRRMETAPVPRTPTRPAPPQPPRPVPIREETVPRSTVETPRLPAPMRRAKAKKPDRPAASRQSAWAEIDLRRWLTAGAAVLGTLLIGTWLFFGGARSLANLPSQLPKLVPGASARANNVRRDSLKQLMLAMHNYHDTWMCFPPAATRDVTGGPLLSWRVLLLPYLGEGILYDTFQFDEPWDSPNNRPLVARMPDVFKTFDAALDREGKTTYLAVTGRNSIFPGTVIRMRDITDGTSNTVMLVDAKDERAVVWTQPGDWDSELESATATLVGHSSDSFIAALADGFVRTIPLNTTPSTLTQLFTRNGGEVIGPIGGVGAVGAGGGGGAGGGQGGGFF